MFLKTLQKTSEKTAQYFNKTISTQNGSHKQYEKIKFSEQFTLTSLQTSTNKCCH